MLKLITGISGTGKTHNVLCLIKQLTQQGKQCILIVPEQFSATAETMLYNTLKDGLSDYASVNSFTSFAEKILKIYGGTSLKSLTEAGRIVTVRRANETLKENLTNYKSHIKNAKFCAMCADVIHELKTAGATPKYLDDISKNTGESGKKIQEISLIWATYEAILSGVALDSTDRLNIATKKIQNDYLNDKYIFIDNFDGFTPPQYNMLEKLMTARECTITLCLDTQNETQGGIGLFSAVRSTALRLIRTAQKNNVQINSPIELKKDYRHENCKVLTLVNEILCNKYDELTQDDFSVEQKKQADKDNLLTITLSSDVYEQCKIVASEITRLVAQGLANFNDITVICREAQNYKQAIKYEFSLADIPYFADETSTLEYCAHASFVRAALQIAQKGINSEDVLRLLKTGLCGQDTQHISELENYAYTWDLSSTDWLQPFVKSPSGFGKQENINKEDKEILDSAESVRSEIIPILLNFIQKIKFNKLSAQKELGYTQKITALQISKALYELFISFNAHENTIKMSKVIEAFDVTCETQNLHRAWNTIMALLDEMNELLSDDNISPQEYDELFALLLQSHDIGDVPMTQDVVIVTTADRMRPINPKYCFVLGVTEGEFPKTAGYSGLLTHEDRDILVKNGIDMPGSYENRTMMEKMFFYRALTAPSKGLYLSAIKEENGAGPLTSELAFILEYLKPNTLERTLAQVAITPNAALDILGTRYRQDNEDTSSLISALSGVSSVQKSLQAMQKAAKNTQFKVQNINAIHEILGNNLTTSPTKIEQFHLCKFSYFLQYVLKIRPRKKAQLSPLETGSLVHYILENTLKQAGDNFCDLTKEELKNIAFDLTHQYVENNMPKSSNRFEYIVNRLKQGALSLLEYLQKEQVQSNFKPVAFEQSIGGNDADDIKPLILKAANGQTVSVVGKIDRVDVMQKGNVNYIRVVDYKTGDKTFNLEQVYCGLNIQMLFYLFMICKNNYKQFENPIASGALYIQADPTVKSVKRKDEQEHKLYKVDGLVLNDDLVLRGMDKDATGYFVPVTFGKNGAARASKKLASLQELGNIEKHIENTIVEMANAIYAGEIEALPLCTKTQKPCNYCDYKTICRHEDGVNEKQLSAPENAFK